MTLELALSGIPMVTAYRVGAMEALSCGARFVSPVILANLVLGQDVIPEFLQENRTAEIVAGPRCSRIQLRRRQIEAFATLDTIMSTGNQPPSVRAADIILATMRKSRRAN